MAKTDNAGFEITGTNKNAPFTLKLHRGEGMTLIAMNWKKGTPPNDFVGFAIEYREPGGDKFYALKNRIGFPTQSGSTNPNRLSTLRSPIQKFKWVHFPKSPEMPGLFTYRVTPVFMNDKEELSYGEAQTADIRLERETYPGELNVTFTRGFVLSQAFVDYYEPHGKLNTLLPPKADEGLTFKPTHKLKDKAYEWMGFEAREAIYDLLDKAIADKKAEVKVVAYDLNEPGLVTRFEKLGKRLQIIIDDSDSHGEPGSAETASEKKLIKTAGKENVKRQHMGNLQHNKMIVVNGTKLKAAVGGSTNFSWRGLYVQSNNALIVYGAKAIAPFLTAFGNYFNCNPDNSVPAFGGTESAVWNDLQFKSVDVKVSFSPHIKSNAMLQAIADDLGKTTSSLFFSLAFLYQTPGAMRNAIKALGKKKDVVVYGVSDRPVNDDGLDVLKPDGKVTVVYPQQLVPATLPEPFKSEPTGGSGNRMHHKFLVVDFNKSSARVYLGSYNFSNPADTKNGENLLLIKDRRIAVSYMIEALRIYDHYYFRDRLETSGKAGKPLQLVKPPRNKKEKPWWYDHYTNKRKINERELFA